jgi:molybdenum cofactor cytidylyltransferase
VVLGCNAQEVATALEGLPVKCIVNERWESGIGSSIHCGIEAIRDASDAAVIMLCDMPFVDANLLNQIITSYADKAASIVASEYDGSPGVPALFSSKYFDELKSLTPEQGAKKVLSAHAAETLLVPFPKGTVDIDTPADAEWLNLELPEPTSS